MNEELRDKRGLAEYTLNLNNVIQQIVSDWNRNVVINCLLNLIFYIQKLKIPCRMANEKTMILEF